jgi:putative intracellular protease/amidase
MNILMVLTSHDQLGNTGEKTGFWLEEFAAPYYSFIDKGAKVTLASPKGGQPPIDPKSSAPDGQTDSTRRFNDDPKAQAALANTKLLSEIDFKQFDGVFYPGGHGPLWDLAENQDSIRLIENFFKAGKPVAAVCHAPAVLRHVMIDGKSIVKGKKVSGFTNSEEEAVKLTKVVPFLLEDELKKLGGKYERGEDWKSHTVVDGLLVTGQNPGSSEEAAQRLMSLL